MKVAGAPISWGVCEVPGWGTQLAADRVLAEMAEVGFNATELGPDGFLPKDPAELTALLERHRLRPIAAFVPLVLHDPEHRPGALAAAGDAAEHLAAVGAEVLVVAAATGEIGYEDRRPLEPAEWEHVDALLEDVGALAETHGLALALHPHLGTMVEGADDVDRVLDTSSVRLCVDTGHLFVGGGDPLAITRTAASAGRVRHVHLKDVDSAIADRVRSGELAYRDAVAVGLYRPLGQGDVPIAEIVDVLERSGYDQWYVLEQDTVLDAGDPPPGSGPINDIRASLAHLDDLTTRGSNRE